MNNKVYIEEIPSLRVHSAEGNNTEIYNLLLPHLVEEFRNKGNNYVAVTCMPPFPMDNDVENLYISYIQSNIKDDNTKIFFDNVYEGHTIASIHGIYKIIKRLNLNPTKCYFISGGMQAIEFHEEYCTNQNILNKINVIILNSWERDVSLRYKLNQNNLFVPQFKIENREKLYLCFNRIVRAHRVGLLGLLYEKNLVENAY